MNQQNSALNYKAQQEADTVEITYFTDPLCCWSYAFAPTWQRLINEYKNEIRYQYVMGGLLPDWQHFNDPVNQVSRPAQMGPVWMQASHISGVPIRGEIWVTDPPVSSYPSCIAVKCAALQSADAGEQYLQMAQEEVMNGLQNISRQDVLVEIAGKLAKKDGSFDAQRFADDLLNGNGREAFRSDWQKAQLQRIDQFPTLIFWRKGYRSVMLAGYQSYDILLLTLQQVMPEIVSS